MLLAGVFLLFLVVDGINYHLRGFSLLWGKAFTVNIHIHASSDASDSAT